MSTVSQRFCRCGNAARNDRPTCGIVICLHDDAYETAIIAAGGDTRATAQQGRKQP